MIDKRRYDKLYYITVAEVLAYLYLEQYYDPNDGSMKNDIISQ